MALNSAREPSAQIDIQNKPLDLGDASDSISSLAQNVEDAAGICLAMSESELYSSAGIRGRQAMRSLATLLEGLAEKGHADAANFCVAWREQRGESAPTRSPSPRKV